jgi:hypothetical protein
MPTEFMEATIFIAGMLHQTGKVYTEEELREFARMSPSTLVVEKDKHGRTCLKARVQVN